jgi:hypothetical protein
MKVGFMMNYQLIIFVFPIFIIFYYPQLMFKIFDLVKIQM